MIGVGTAEVLLFNRRTGKSGWTKEEAEGEDDAIQEKFDEKRQMPYYVNLRTGRTGWTREEVTSSGLPVGIEKRFDASRNLPYFVNRFVASLTKMCQPRHKLFYVS